MKPIKPQKSWAKVYRKAAQTGAEMVRNGSNFLCCIRIDVEGGTLDEKAFFEFLFKPVTREWQVRWWDKGDTESRLVALLLAAEICERGEDWS